MMVQGRILQKLKFALLLSALAWAAAAPVSWAAPLAIGGSTQSLAFGSFVAVSGGSVTITANPPGRGSSGTVVLLPSGTWSAASFSVTGDPSATYAITLPANGAVALTSGANTMAVNAFTSSPASTGQLGAGGSQTLGVGATLSVGNNQAAGSYSGSFVVTVEYN
jgi:hypothetical protein